MCMTGTKLYFHCAKAGHKLDAIRAQPKASFCVIDQDQIVPAEYTTYFRSVIAFGTVRILEDEQAKSARRSKSSRSNMRPRTARQTAPVRSSASGRRFACWK